MIFEVTLKAKELTTGTVTNMYISLNVELAPSGLYIASDPGSPLTPVGAGKLPLYAILDYLGNHYEKTVEDEKQQSQ